MSMSNTKISTYVELITFFVVMNSTSLEFQGMNFPSVANILRMHGLTKVVSKPGSTVRVSKILKQGQTYKSQKCKRRGNTLFSFTTSSFAVYNYCDSIGLMRSSLAGWRKCLWNNSRLASVTSKPATNNKVLPVIKIELGTCTSEHARNTPHYADYRHVVSYNRIVMPGPVLKFQLS